VNGCAGVALRRVAMREVKSEGTVSYGTGSSIERASSRAETVGSMLRP